MGIWLPGYSRHVFPGRTGFPFAFTGAPKLCWHTTEGGSVAGALGAYAPYPPHLIVNPLSGEKLQHISLDLAAYSAMDNNDRQHLIQLEVVGFAASSHTWPDWVLRWLADNVVRPIRDAVGVPDRALRFYGAGEGITLASENSPIRLSENALRQFSGHVGHQHLSSPDSHWDPGALNITKILAFAAGGDEDDLNETQDGALLETHALVVRLVQALLEGKGSEVHTNQTAKNLGYIIDEVDRRAAARDGKVLEVLERIAKSLETAAPEPLPERERRVHTVVAGDTLYSVSRTYGTTVQLLNEWNNLSSQVLTVGQTLYVEAPRG